MAKKKIITARRSILSANDRQAAVAWHEYKPENLNVSLFAKGGELVVKQVTAWKMKSIYQPNPGLTPSKTQ